jgi:hypothetical protein
MMRSVTATLTALVVMGGLASPVHAGPISGSFSGNSVFTPTGTPGVLIQNFTGGGTDTTYGPFTFLSLSTVDFTNPPSIVISNGSFTETFAIGSLFGTSSGTGTANGNGTASLLLNLVVTGGTFAFERFTGNATITGMITLTSPTTGATGGTYAGTLRDTDIPEPSTLAIVGAGIMGLGALRRRRKAKPKLSVS